MEDLTIASRDGGEGSRRHQTLQAGTRVGRYIVLEMLGRGGMGVVYKAYDPDLDRRIALKLLSVGQKEDSTADRARERLLREAQALAQLSHPNVVSAFDVGTLEQDVFVAMELVEGKTLRQWLEQTKPDLARKLQVLGAAGRGLAAAHQAGLVHRDFKPDNVVIGDVDGRVRVLDFGLARLVARDEAVGTPSSDSTPAGGEPEEPHSSETPGSFLSTPMTLAGTLVGTPGYMAPEQFLGGEIDALTDQYSFCVTLYEVLYGVRPHTAANLKTLKAKITTEPVEPPPQSARVPAWIRRIVLRGLSIDRQDRYTSMDALLEDLQRDPRIRRKKLGIVAGAVMLVGLAFAAALGWQAHRQGLCRGAERLLDGVWDDARREAVREAFHQTGRTYAQDTTQRITRLLDERARDWVRTRQEACEATRLRGEQSEHLMDLRMQCLDGVRNEMKALIEVFAGKSDVEVLDQAVAAVTRLRSLAGCSDVTALTSAFPPPEDPEARARLEALRARLDAAEALEKGGKVAACLEESHALLKEARALDHPPLLAEVWALIGALERNRGDPKAAEEAMRSGIAAAARARDDRLLAELSASLIYVIGYMQERAPVAMELATLAEAIVTRSGGEPLVEADLVNSMAVIRAIHGEREAAYEGFKRALELKEANLPKDSPELGPAYKNLGTVLEEMGRYPEALKYHQRSVEILSKLLGEDHPRVGSGLVSLGNDHYLMDHLEEAATYYRKARELFEKNHLVNRSLANAVNNLGEVYYAQENYEASLVEIRLALELRRQVFGPEHPQVAVTIGNLGNVLDRLGRHAEALKIHQEALEMLDRSFPQGHRETVFVLTGLGSCLTALGQTGRAVASIERALRLGRQLGVEPDKLGGASFAMAQALWAQGGQRARAIAAAREALQRYREEARRSGPIVREIEAWIRAHGEARVRPGGGG